MPEIGIADKETLDKIDTNVGAKTDAASSTGSLHAKVRDAKNAINAGNSTVNTINTNVGAKADAASATGSLHAKVKTANDRIGTANPSSGGTDTLFKYLRRIYDAKLKLTTPKFTYGSVDYDSSLQPLLSVSGSGFVTGIIVQAGNKGTYGSSIVAVVTLDGVDVVSVLATRPDNDSDSDGQWITVMPLMHRFNSSLLVKHRGTIRYGQGGTTRVSYILD